MTLKAKAPMLMVPRNPSDKPLRTPESLEVYGSLFAEFVSEWDDLDDDGRAPSDAPARKKAEARPRTKRRVKAAA